MSDVRYIYLKCDYPDLAVFGNDTNFTVLNNAAGLERIFSTLKQQLDVYNGLYRIQYGNGITEPDYFLYPHWNIFILNNGSDDADAGRLSRTSYNTSANPRSVDDPSNMFMSHLVDHLEYVYTNPQEGLSTLPVTYYIEPHPHFKHTWRKVYRNPNLRSRMLMPINGDYMESFRYTVTITDLCGCNDDIDVTTLEPLVNPVMKFPNTRHCFNTENNLRRFTMDGQESATGFIVENPITRQRVPLRSMVFCQSNEVPDPPSSPIPTPAQRERKIRKRSTKPKSKTHTRGRSKPKNRGSRRSRSSRRVRL